MSDTSIAGALIAKAIRAGESANLLLADGDIDGACDRAYYAMFNAARAALLAANVGITQDIGKTHSGLISAFGLQLVKTGRIPNEFGKSLNRAEEIRLIADYKGDSVEFVDANELVLQADRFVETMRSIFFPQH